MRVGSDAFEASFSPKTRESEITNPEEVVGAALAGCYSLMLAKTLNDAGHTPRSVETAAAVELEQDNDGPHISQVSLIVNVESDGLDTQTLQELSKKADDDCPVSKALGGTSIKIDANLSGGNGKA